VGEGASTDLETLRREAAHMGRKRNFGLDAVRVNTRILEEDPDDFGALYRRGKCYEAQDDFPAARADYSRALRIKPGTSYVQEALIRIERGWEGAEERAEKARARRRAEEARQAEKARAKAEDFRRVEAMTSFEEAYDFGVVASKGSRPDYPLAIAALKKAWILDPRKSDRRGEKPNPGLFEVPTRLARIYRKTGQLDRARLTYEWVLTYNDSRFAKVGLAAVHEACGRHTEALDLYEEVLSRIPRDPYALRGMAKALSSLRRFKEAVEAYQEAAEASGRSGKDFAAAVTGLEKMREDAQREGETDRSQWIASVLWRLRDS
jgi:tetratricopeptide (TPR) repeat protein